MANKLEIKTTTDRTRIPDNQNSLCNVERMVFTAGDHLEVQQQIGQRAHEFWCARKSARDTALEDWLLAEREIIKRFIRNYAWLHSLPRSSRPKSPVSVVQTNPGKRILKRGRTVVATHSQSTSV
jgi:hypothetical protein